MDEGEGKRRRKPKLIFFSVFDTVEFSRNTTAAVLRDPWQRHIGRTGPLHDRFRKNLFFHEFRPTFAIHADIDKVFRQIHSRIVQRTGGKTDGIRFHPDSLIQRHSRGFLQISTNKYLFSTYKRIGNKRKRFIDEFRP